MWRMAVPTTTRATRLTPPQVPRRPPPAPPSPLRLWSEWLFEQRLGLHAQPHDGCPDAHPGLPLPGGAGASLSDHDRDDAVAGRSCSHLQPPRGGDPASKDTSAAE